LVLLPAEPLTVSVTVYTPGAVYTCDGFCAVLVVPSPKLQEYVPMVPVEELVKFTFNGAEPDVGLPLKAAVGGVEGVSVVAIPTFE
jgi:hypothetical protein